MRRLLTFTQMSHPVRDVRPSCSSLSAYVTLPGALIPFQILPSSVPLLVQACVWQLVSFLCHFSNSFHIKTVLACPGPRCRTLFSAQVQEDPAL